MANEQARRFEQAVIENFRFLETECGFRRQPLQEAGVDWTSVTYETDALYVRLTYWPPEYWPMMQFGQSGVDDVQGAESLGPDDLFLTDSCTGFPRNYAEPDRLTGGSSSSHG